MKISTKLILIGMIICMILIGSFSYFSYKKVVEQEGAAEMRELKAHYAIVLEHILFKQRTANALAALVANVPSVQEALATRNREQLAAWFKDSFSKMKENHGVEQFQFHIKGKVETGLTAGEHSDAVSFLRLHKLEKYGDDLSGFRKSVVAANVSRKPQSGLEKGIYGLGVRGVVPVFHLKEHVGSVEFGMVFNNNSFDSLKERYDINVLLNIVGNRNVKAGQKNLENIDLKHAVFHTFAQSYFDETEGKYYPNILNIKEIKDIFGSERESLLYKTIVKKPVIIYSNIIRDFSNRKIGILSIILDRTEYLHTINSVRNIIIFSSLFILAVTVSFLVLIVRTMRKPIIEMAKELETIIEHVSHRKNITEMTENFLPDETDPSAKKSPEKLFEINDEERNVSKLSILTSGSDEKNEKRSDYIVAMLLEQVDHTDELSRKILSITQLLDGIAFEINILSLNAAIESQQLRTGGQVSARLIIHIRTLSKYFVNAAKEVESLAGNIVVNSENSKRLINEIQNKMEEMVGSVKVLFKN